MRIQFIALFVLLGLIVGGRVEAQTWEQPDILWPYDAVSANTCFASNTIDSFDGWSGYGPDIVYQFLTLYRPPHPFPGGFGGTTQTPTPEFLTLVPNRSYPPVDFEVFVCSYKSGNSVWNCQVEGDNIYNLGSTIQVTIPPEDLTFHIIVTSGMLNENYNYGQGCGAYTLITSH